jgi:hypothetical protein
MIDAYASIIWRSGPGSWSDSSSKSRGRSHLVYRYVLVLSRPWLERGPSRPTTFTLTIRALGEHTPFFTFTRIVSA